RLRVLVEALHVRVGRRAVEIEVALLDVFPVIALTVREPEESLLQDGVLTVPEGESEAEPLLVVGDPTEAVLAPPVRAGTGVIVSEEVPSVAVVAVVLAHRSPLAVREVWSPLLPRDVSAARFLQATLLCIHLASPCLVRSAVPLARPCIPDTLGTAKGTTPIQQLHG